MLRTALLGDEEGKDGLLTELLRSALLGGEAGENPLMAALQEAVINALLGGEEGESPFAQAFRDAIGSANEEGTPLGAATLEAKDEIRLHTQDATDTAVATIQGTRDDALNAARYERILAIGLIHIERDKAIAMIRGGGGGPDPAKFQEPQRLGESVHAEW
jgi:hypothetical protein